MLLRSSSIPHPQTQNPPPFSFFINFLLVPFGFYFLWIFSSLHSVFSLLCCQRFQPLLCSGFIIKWDGLRGACFLQGRVYGIVSRHGRDSQDPVVTCSTAPAAAARTFLMLLSYLLGVLNLSSFPDALFTADLEPFPNQVNSLLSRLLYSPRLLHQW